MFIIKMPSLKITPLTELLIFRIDFINDYSKNLFA